MRPHLGSGPISHARKWPVVIAGRAMTGPPLWTRCKGLEIYRDGPFIFYQRIAARYIMRVSAEHRYRSIYGSLPIYPCKVIGAAILSRLVRRQALRALVIIKPSFTLILAPPVSGMAARKRKNYGRPFNAPAIPWP